MAIKMVTCVICHKEVTKKSTLSLADLNGQEGRACRTHSNVENLNDQRQRQDMKRLGQERAVEREKVDWQETVRFERIMAFSKITVQHIADHIVTEESLLKIAKKCGFKESDVPEIIEAIRALGGLVISPEAIKILQGAGLFDIEQIDS